MVEWQECDTACSWLAGPAQVQLQEFHVKQPPESRPGPGAVDVYQCVISCIVFYRICEVRRKVRLDFGETLMIRNIIGKEILKNLLSLRFMLSLLLIISLFATGGFMFVGKHQQESNDYWKDTNRNLSSLREHTNHLYELVTCRQVVWRQPKPLSLCAEGSENTLPDRFSFDPFTWDLPEVRSRSNFLLPHFSDIDWVFTISLIVSFVALLLTYDSICGEKQTGTLRLMLAGSIPRHKVLLGKYFGAMLTIGIPPAVGLDDQPHCRSFLSSCWNWYRPVIQNSCYCSSVIIISFDFYTVRHFYLQSKS